MPQIEQIFIERLKEEQAKCIQLLHTPTKPTEFGYGEACGLAQGLNRAEQLFLEVIGEEDDGT